jgi:hypothetical protein
MIAEMAKKHSCEAFYAQDDLLEAKVLCTGYDDERMG